MSTSGCKVTSDFGGDDAALAVALQTDGKIVAAGSAGVTGNSNFALARYEDVTPPVNQPPRVFCMDGNRSYPGAIRDLQAECGDFVESRTTILESMIVSAGIRAECLCATQAPVSTTLP